MKKTVSSLLLCSTLLTTLLSGGMAAFATDYPSATSAENKGEVVFEKDTDPTNPVDPTDPTNPIDPTDPTNPNPGELSLVYVSKFNFGTQKADGKKTTAYAKADTVNDGEGVKAIVPFVATKDVRGTERKGWSLTVKQNDGFKDSKGNELTGAEITLSGTKYVESAGAPTVSSDKLVISNQAKELISADAKAGVGNWSAAFGELTEVNDEQVTKGITLTVPSNTAKNADAYSTTLTWELTADPTK